MPDPRWADETQDLVADLLYHGRDGDGHVDAHRILAALADAGLLVEPGAQAELDGMWRSNAKLHNDMRRRATRATARRDRRRPGAAHSSTPSRTGSGRC